MLTRTDLKRHHVYSAKRKATIAPHGYINDRAILSIRSQRYKGRVQEVVEYDTPGWNHWQSFPVVSVAEFLRWAKEDVTAQLPKYSWRYDE